MSSPPTVEFNLTDFLSDVGTDVNDSVRSLNPGTAGIKDPLYEAGYEGKIDYRIRQLSFSSRTTLAECPRKFQLGRLRTADRKPVDFYDKITFDFGHIVGDGIQRVLQGQSDRDILFASIAQWSTDLYSEDPKRAKSFFLALLAIKRFRIICESGALKNYELVYHKGLPACEFSFAICFPDGFRYRGFVDVVLRHRFTGKIVVLEVKTSSSDTTNPSIYKNSGQAIGYSIVLDHIFPDLTTYEVLYLVYGTKNLEYTIIQFVKSYLQRALWIRELMLDIEMVKMYEEAEVYPMRGNQCVSSFFKECEYINSCTMSTKYLSKEASTADFDNTEYMVNVNLIDLLETQMEKTTV